MISGGVRSLDEPGLADVDLLIVACGSEERSSSLVRSQSVRARKIIGLQFEFSTDETYRANSQYLEENGIELIVGHEKYFRNKFKSDLLELQSRKGQALQIGIDVSSMNRTMIANAIISIMSLEMSIDRITTFYLPSEFKEPRLEFPIVDRVGAVIPEFSGFDSDPRLPFALAMGLGYEYGVGAGLINQIEPRYTLCMRAVGHDKRFEEAVRKANLNFEFGHHAEVGSYNLLDPLGAYQRLENICHGLTKNYRLVIVPMGPKIFAAMSLLCAVKYFGIIAVWRVVAKSEPANVRANGKCVWLTGDISDFASTTKHRLLQRDLA